MFAALLNRSHQPKRSPKYHALKQHVESVCYQPSEIVNWYPPVMLNAEAVQQQLFRTFYLEETIKLYERLTSDAYIEYLLSYYKEGLRRFGEAWRYADIVTALMTLTDILKPASYLEIGVRRGRSACAVASRAPSCALYLFDMWKNKNYAGMDNPGPEFVEEELVRVGHAGAREYVLGDSHQTLSRFFQQHPDTAFDLITVDGDHSFDGAVADLCDVLPHLKIGGAVVFDDICHPQKPHLRRVWKNLVEDEARFSTCSLDDIGYGVGFGIRLW